MRRFNKNIKSSGCPSYYRWVYEELLSEEVSNHLKELKKKQKITIATVPFILTVMTSLIPITVKLTPSVPTPSFPGVTPLILTAMLSKIQKLTLWLPGM